MERDLNTKLMKAWTAWRLMLAAMIASSTVGTALAEESESEASSEYFEEDILNLSLETAIQSRNSVGGTAKSIVEKALSKAKKEIKIATDHYEKN